MNPQFSGPGIQAQKEDRDTEEKDACDLVQKERKRTKGQDEGGDPVIHE